MARKIPLRIQARVSSFHNSGRRGQSTTRRGRQSSTCRIAASSTAKPSYVYLPAIAKD